MREYKYNFKIICRNKIFLFSYSLIFGLFLSYLIYGFYSAFHTTDQIFIYDLAYNTFKQTTSLIPYCLPAILFTALYVFNLNRQNHMEELILCIAPYQDKKAKGQVLITWLFFVYSLFLGLNLYAFYKSDFRESKAFLVQIIFYLTVNYFVLGILMITIAFALSIVKKVSYQILLAGASICVFGGYFKNYFYERAADKELFYKLYAFVQVITPGGKDWALQPYVGETVQLHQIGIILFWGSVSGLIAAIALGSKRRYFTGTLILALLILLLPYEEIGQSYYAGNGSWYPMYYYNNDGGHRTEEYETKPQFEVTDYHMDLWTLTCLKAEVTASVSESNLKEYEFTLYHPYQILHIKDQDGKKLTYLRNGDYLTVYPIEGKELSQIKFSYYGNGKGFYSQLEGINLVPGILFFPIPGFHTVYGSSTEGVYEFIPCYLERKAEFLVTVHSPLTVYSTLNQLEKNVFSGKADTVGLFAGLFMKKTIVDDVTFIHSQIEQFKFSGFDSYKDAIEYAELLNQKSIKKNLSFHKKLIIALPVVAYDIPLKHENYFLFREMVEMSGLDYLAETYVEDADEEMDQ